MEKSPSNHSKEEEISENKQVTKPLSSAKDENIITIASWNINGLRAVNKRGDLKRYIESLNPDIICLNETKIDAKTLDQSSEADVIPKEYIQHWNCCKSRAGYSGVAIMSKIKPISVKHDIGVSEHDQEGRSITLEFEKFYLVSCYVPNAGQKLERLSYRTKNWDTAFRAYLNGLKEKKAVILTGDLNVAHKPMDIFNPKNTKAAGVTPEERAEFTKLLEDGWVDTFRHLYPEKVKFSYFSAMGKNREENKGWRLDYFLVTEKHLASVISSDINEKVTGSDHLPVEVTVDLSKL